MKALAKRMISLLLAAAVFVSLFPQPAYAALDGLSDEGRAIITEIDQTGWGDEKFDFSDSYSNLPFFLCMICGDIANVFPNISTGPFYNSEDSYRAAFACLANNQEFSAVETSLTDAGEYVEILSCCNDIREFVAEYLKEDAVGNSKFPVIDAAGYVYDVSECLWEVLQLSQLGQDTYTTIGQLAKNSANANLKSAAKGIVAENPSYYDGGYASQFLSKYIIEDIRREEKRIAQKVGDIVFTGVFHLYSATSTVMNQFLNKTTPVADMKLYRALGEIQAETKHAISKLKVEDFESEEDFIETYRALTATYIKTAAAACQLAYQMDMISEETYQECAELMYHLVTGIQTAGTELMIDEEDASVNPPILENYAFPSALSVGDTFVSWGTVRATTSEGLHEVSVVIMNTKTYESVDTAVSGNLDGVAEYQLFMLDNQLDYNLLQSGSYTLRVSADGQLIYQSDFVVYAEDHLFIVDGYRLPGVQQQGKPFVVRGYVVGENELSSVKVLIKDNQGNTRYGKAYDASSHTFSLGVADSDLLFDQLESGRFCFFVEATDVLGNVETMICQPFRVG